MSNKFLKPLSETARVRYLAAVIILSIVFLSVPIYADTPMHLAAVQRYMPNTYYSSKNTINYIYEKIWTIDRPITATRLTYPAKLTNKEKFYQHSSMRLISQMLRKIAKNHSSRLKRSIQSLQ